jgi:hypothetical protein
MSDRRQPCNHDRQRIAPAPATRNALIRRAELFRVLACRYGYDRLPADKEGRDMAFAICVAYLRCKAGKNELRNTVRGLAPFLTDDGFEAMKVRAVKRTKIGRGLGRLIGLTEAERRECRAWRLQSIDGPTPAEANSARRKHDGTVDRRGRRACKGAKTRVEADAAKRAANAGSERQTKPWEALGISRRWYYVLKRRGALVQSAPGSAEHVHSRSLLQSSVSALPGALAPAQADSTADRAPANGALSMFGKHSRNERKARGKHRGVSSPALPGVGKDMQLEHRGHP